MSFIFGSNKTGPDGPRMLDLTVSSSTNGASIIIGYGTNAMGANLIWSPGLVEQSVTTTVSSKGGPTTTSTQFLYTASFAAAFCEGPGTIIKIWGDAQVLFDATSAFSNYQGVFNNQILYTPGQVVKFDNGSTTQFYQCILTATGLPFPDPTHGLYWTTYAGQPVAVAGGQQYPSPTLYPGTDTQMPDPTIQAGLGVSGTSAFRGLVYAVWDNLALTNFGNRIPSIRGVVQSGPPDQGMTVTLTSVATAVGSNAVYTGIAIPGVVDGDWVGYKFTVDGFTDADNNGPSLVCVASTGAVPGGTTCTLTLVNPTATAETNPATAVNGAQGSTGVDAIVEDVCVRAGIPATELDTTDLEFISTTVQDIYQPDGTGIPALTLLSGGVINFYQQSDGSTGVPFLFTYPGKDGNIPLPSPKATYTMSPTDTLLFNPYPASSPIGYPAFTGFLPGWTTLDSYNLTPMTIVGVQSGGSGPATWDGTATAPFVPQNVGHFSQANWGMVATVQLNVAVAGNYTFKVSCKDAILIGMGGGATRVSGPMVNQRSQTMTAAKGYPIMLAQNVSTPDGTHLDPNGVLLNMTLSTFVVNFPAPGVYGMECDYACHDDARVFNVNWIMGDAQSPLLQVAGTAGADPIQNAFGYTITSQTDGKSIVNDLQKAFFFDSAESDFKLKFIRRGVHSPVLTISEDDLGLIADKAKIKETIVQEQEAPQTVSVTYVDPTIDFQKNLQSKQRSSRIVTTYNQETLDFTLVTSETAALQIAEKTLYSRWMERQAFEFNLWKAFYSLLDTTDTVIFVNEGVPYEERLKEVAIGQNFATALTGANQQAAAYASVAVGGGSGGYIVTVETDGGVSMAFMFDIPYLQDSDASLDRLSNGFYWVVVGEDPDWSGGVLLQSPTGATYSQLGDQTLKANFGYATTKLPDAPAFYAWDTTSTLTIQMVRGALTGTSDINVYAGANAMLVGNELIQFANAVQNMDGTYTISRLLRGRRNTEPFAKNHTTPVGTPPVGDACLLVDATLQRSTFPNSFIGMTEDYKAVTYNQDPSLAIPTTFTSAGNDLKPASPVQLYGTRDLSDNLTLGFTRRTRYGGLGLVGPTPLNEDVENYSVDVLNGMTVVRTIAWTGSYDGNGNPTVAYSAADQITDFGSTQSAIAVVVYQLSVQVGRGFPAAATV